MQKYPCSSTHYKSTTNHHSLLTQDSHVNAVRYGGLCVNVLRIPAKRSSSISANTNIPGDQCQRKSIREARVKHVNTILSKSSRIDILNCDALWCRMIEQPFAFEQSSKISRNRLQRHIS